MNHSDLQIKKSRGFEEKNGQKDKKKKKKERDYWVLNIKIIEARQFISQSIFQKTGLWGRLLTFSFKEEQGETMDKRKGRKYENMWWRVERQDEEWGWG